VDATQPHNLSASGPAAPSPPITLVCISDTHNSKPDLPDGDILLHAGDLSQYGTFDEIQAQLDWLNSHLHPHKIVIAGNHDLLLDSAFAESHPDRELDRHPSKRRADLDWGGVCYLQHGSVSVEVRRAGTGAKISRHVHIFGSPWTPRMGSWAFQYDPQDTDTDTDSGSGSGSGFPHLWEGAIPRGVDVVLVHGPPAGHVDNGGKGCQHLLAELWRVRPRVVICGHIHAGRGHELLVFDRVQRYYEDVALGRCKWITSLLFLGVCTVWWWAATTLMKMAARGTLSDTTCDHKDKDELLSMSTWLVNASIAGGHGKVKKRDPYVVLL
jgi:hypothetical protein